jgi:hypothetical protein
MDDVVRLLQDEVRELRADVELYERWVEWAVQEARESRRVLAPLLDALRAVEAEPAAARDIARSVLAAYQDGTLGR